jgi:CheY-like chemotaxis protein
MGRTAYPPGGGFFKSHSWLHRLTSQMPEMNGVTLAREIRQRVRTALILLSSSGEIITGTDADLFHLQIPKPVRRSSLFNALVDIVATESRQPLKKTEREINSSMASTHPLRILLAEDNTVNQRFGLLMLSRLDAARVIREKLGTKCPSIFALTAEALEGDKQRFLGLGFVGYLSKPLQMHTLQEALKTIIPCGSYRNAGDPGTIGKPVALEG